MNITCHNPPPPPSKLYTHSFDIFLPSEKSTSIFSAAAMTVGTVTEGVGVGVGVGVEATVVTGKWGMLEVSCCAMVWGESSSSSLSVLSSLLLARAVCPWSRLKGSTLNTHIQYQVFTECWSRTFMIRSCPPPPLFFILLTYQTIFFIFKFGTSFLGGGGLGQKKHKLLSLVIG